MDFVKRKKKKNAWKVTGARGLPLGLHVYVFLHLASLQSQENNLFLFFTFFSGSAAPGGSVIDSSEMTFLACACSFCRCSSSFVSSLFGSVSCLLDGKLRLHGVSSPGLVLAAKLATCLRWFCDLCGYEAACQWGNLTILHQHLSRWPGVRQSLTQRDWVAGTVPSSV